MHSAIVSGTQVCLCLQFIVQKYFLQSNRLMPDTVQLQHLPVELLKFVELKLYSVLVIEKKLNYNKISHLN